jgi:hypothetical protein
VKNSLRLSTFVIRDEANVWTLNVLTPSYPEFGTSAHDTLIRASTLPPKKTHYSPLVVATGQEDVNDFKIALEPPKVR